jgi:hypothetical protein
MRITEMLIEFAAGFAEFRKTTGGFPFFEKIKAKPTEVPAYLSHSLWYAPCVLQNGQRTKRVL